MSSYIYGVNNYSLYALPTAWFCAVLPHWYGIYKYKTLNRGEWDNACPPAFVAALQKREKLSADEKMILRAQAAQMNGFINLPWFGVALLAGNFAKLPNSTLNMCAAIYIASRIGFNISYIVISDNGLSKIRTAFFLTGIISCFTLIIKAANVPY